MRDSNYVLASTFPKASSSKNNLFLNYNYYVVNIDSKNILAAQNILAYFASEK
jgi:maltose-binding protein MalE